MAEISRREFFKKTATDAAVAGFLAAAGVGDAPGQSARLPHRQPDLSRTAR